MNNIDEGGLVSIAQEDALPTSLRAKALVLLRNQNGEGWTEVQPLAVHIFVQTLDLDELATILLEDELAIPTHPFETLIVAHLLSANHDEVNWKSARRARKRCKWFNRPMCPPQSTKMNTNCCSSLKRIQESVSKLELTGTLPKKGILAVNQIVNALSSGGSHLVDEKHLNNVIESLEEGEMTDMGEALLRTIVSKLRLNNIRLSLERGDDTTQVIPLLETVLKQPSIPYPIVDGVRELMYEFDLGIESLVQWYQSHHPRSIWALLAQRHSMRPKARISLLHDCSNGQQILEVAYDEDDALPKALIHFAFDKKWGEAKQLLSEHPNLRAAVRNDSNSISTCHTKLRFKRLLRQHQC